MFLIIDREQDRGSALVAALVARGEKAQATASTEATVIAAGVERPRAVLVSTDTVDRLDVIRLNGARNLGEVPLLFFGERPGAVYRAFVPTWRAGREFRWQRTTSGAELAAWATAEAVVPARPPASNRAERWTRIIAMVLGLLGLGWAFLARGAPFAENTFLLANASVFALLALPPVVAAVRRGVPLSAGARFLAGLAPFLLATAAALPLLPR